MGSSRVPDNHDPGPVPSAHTKLRERGISSVTAHAGSMPRPTTAPSQSFSVEPPELFMIKSEFYSPLLSPALLAAKFQCWHYANGAQSPFPTPQPHAIFYRAIVSLRQYRRHHILSSSTDSLKPQRKIFLPLQMSFASTQHMLMPHSW